MPIYEYRCATCADEFETIQKFSDPPPKACAKCGGKLEKLLSRSGFSLKGAGWYADGYGGKASSRDGGSPGGDGTASSGAGKASDSAGRPAKDGSGGRSPAGGKPPSSD